MKPKYLSLGVVACADIVPPKKTKNLIPRFPLMGICDDAKKAS